MSKMTFHVLLDSRQCVVLLLFDVSAAFDTLLLNIISGLLQRISSKFGIKEKVLDWLRSYLPERSQFGNIIEKSLMSTT